MKKLWSIFFTDVIKKRKEGYFSILKPFPGQKLLCDDLTDGTIY